uniref:Uncharacterized protein n=1 Tax=Bacillus phage KoopaTroopa TaxID=3234046 RepID=A0AB39C6Z9_9CAUD
MRFDSLSKNVVNVMKALSNNQGLLQLLVNDVENPFDPNLPVINGSNVINPKHALCRIKPYPFDVEATDTNGSFIRVYYNYGDLDESETISETTLHIDIVVAKELWLIKGNMIRPYEIMARVIDMVGKRGVGTGIKLNINGFQHLAVNTKFDAIRITSEYMTVEA